jgi:hypothetical protein
MSILPFTVSRSTDLRGLNDGVLNACSGWRSYPRWAGLARLADN